MYALGDVPKLRLKTRLKCEELENPQDKAMSVTERDTLLGFLSALAQCATRRCQM